MKFYEASITISASPERVWEVLTSASRYTEWDSGLEKVEGEIVLGQTIKVFAKISPGRAFPVKVVALDASRRMVWRGGMPLGLFKGVRQFNLASEGAITSFTMREEFTGPLLPLMWKVMPDLQGSFDPFAQGLKAEAERGQGRSKRGARQKGRPCGRPFS
jgi:hypothetical protein